MKQTEVEQAESESCEHAAWVWTAIGIGAAAGAIAVVWLMQYRKPDRSLDRLLRRCSDRLDEIETTVSGLADS
jgi:hypothetical protein